MSGWSAEEDVFFSSGGRHTRWDWSTECALPVCGMGVLLRDAAKQNKAKRYIGSSEELVTASSEESHEGTACRPRWSQDH